MTVRVRPRDLKLPEYMTRGGPGDLSMPGNVNTTEQPADRSSVASLYAPAPRMQPSA